MKTISKYVASALLVVTIFSCEDTIINNYTGTGEEKTYSIEGYAQKGPFIVGSNVTVSELNDDLYPTGRVFFATILDNKGHFEIPGVVLVSPYIQIKVEGSYFSEMQGGVPVPGNLTLYSIADIRETQSINVNLITHLTKERIEDLVQNGDLSFEDARTQALDEFLTIFNWENYEISNGSELNIAENNQGGAVLLALSSIFENTLDHTVRLETITNFQVDFTDGDIDSGRLKSRLLTNASFIEPEVVSGNLKIIYPNATLPDFAEVLEAFITNSTYPNFKEIVLPEVYNGKLNLLRLNEGPLNTQVNYSIVVVLADSIPVSVAGIGLNSYTTTSGTFEAPSDRWTTFDQYEGNCMNSDGPCLVKSYGISDKDQSFGTIEIPITLTGHGETNYGYMLIIDGHAISLINRQTTW